MILHGEELCELYWEFSIFKVGKFSGLATRCVPSMRKTSNTCGTLVNKFLLHYYRMKGQKTKGKRWMQHQWLWCYMRTSGTIQQH